MRAGNKTDGFKFKCPRRSEGPNMSWYREWDGWVTDYWRTPFIRAVEHFFHMGRGFNFLLWLHKHKLLRRYPYQGGTMWRWPWQPRTCNFCGGVNPVDAERLLREGWTIEKTTKGYKAYLNPPSGSGWSPVPPVKAYGMHFPPGWVPPEPSTEPAKARRSGLPPLVPIPGSDPETN